MCDGVSIFYLGIFGRIRMGKRGKKIGNFCIVHAVFSGLYMGCK
jgi:hypothetical protein